MTAGTVFGAQGRAGDARGRLDEVFIARQPILHASGRVHGYELLFRSAGEGEAGDNINLTWASASIAVALLTEIGLPPLVGESLAYINVDRGFLLSDMIEALPTRKIVLQFAGGQTADDITIRRVEQLRNRGFRLALEDTDLACAPKALARAADIVRVDVGRCGIDGLRSPGQGAPAHSTLLADNVDDSHLAAGCRRAGIPLLQGVYFSKPATVTGRRLDIETKGLIRVLSLLLGDAPDREIVAALKLCPQLIYRLLRVVNSAHYALSRPVNSLGAALLVVGRQPFARLVQMLLFTRASGTKSPALLEMAAARGRLMELLWQQNHPGDAIGAEHAFIAGLFSLMAAALEMTTGDLLESVDLPAVVGDALTGDGSGPLHALLEIARFLETDRSREALALYSVAAPRMPIGRLPRLQQESLVWATSVSGKFYAN